MFGHWKMSKGLWLWWCLVVEICQRELKRHNCVTAIAPKSNIIRIGGRFCQTLSAFLSGQKNAQKSKITQKSALESKSDLLSAHSPSEPLWRIKIITYLPSLSSACITRVNSYVCVVSRRHCLIVYAKLQSGIQNSIQNLKEYSRRRQQQDRVQSRGSRSLPQVVGWKRGGNQTKTFDFKNIEKGRQNIPYLLFSWRRSGGSRSQTK